MERRQITRALLAATAGMAALTPRSQAQSCTSPCYAETTAEVTAGVTITNSAYPPMNVYRYGAVGTGKTNTDDTVPLQDAIKVASVIGGQVILPPGTYRVTAGLAVGTSGDGGVTLLGAGPHASVIASASTTGDIITLTGNVPYLQIIGLNITPSVARTSGAAIRVLNSGVASISNVAIYGGFDGISIDTTNGGTPGPTHLDNFYIHGVSNNGVNIGNGSTAYPEDVFVSNGNVVNSAIYGINIVWGSGLLFSDVQVESNSVGTTAINVSPGKGQFVQSLYMSQVEADSSVQDGWIFGGSGYIANVELVNCWGSSNGNVGVGLVNPSINGFTINGGTFTNNDQSGLYINDGTNILINGAKVFNNSLSGKKDAAGIAVGAGISEFQIVNCICGNGGQLAAQNQSNNQSYGILVSTGASNNYVIQNNRCPGNQSGGIFDGGSGTNKFVVNNLSS